MNRAFTLCFLEEADNSYLNKKHQKPEIFKEVDVSESQELTIGGLVVVVLCSSLLNFGFNLPAGIFCCIFSILTYLHLFVCIYENHFSMERFYWVSFVRKPFLIINNITLKETKRCLCHLKCYVLLHMTRD